MSLGYEDERPLTSGLCTENNCCIGKCGGCKILHCKLKVLNKIYSCQIMW